MPPDPASPWPAGTVVSDSGMQGSIVFSPATAPEGTMLSYVATLTNPADHWLFVPLDDWRAFSSYLWTPETEDGAIPRIVNGVPSSAPEFQHSTSAGPRTGLLLPPHGSYSFGGRTDNAVEADDATTDDVAYADISFTPVGVADATGPIARDAGTFTVLVPPSSTTTTEISA